jgi:glycerol kinase
VGFWDGEQDLASQWRANAHFEPRMSNYEAEKLYTGWQRAMERARGWGQKSS